MNNSMKILIVDDEEPIRRMISILLKQSGYEVFLSACGKDALKILETESIDVVVTDIAMPGMDGIELTKHIRRRFDADVIMMTGHIKDLAYVDAITEGASDFVPKPFDFEEFKIRLRRVLKERQILKELNENINSMKVMLDGVIHSLSYMVETRDPYTPGHQKRVSKIAGAVSQELGLSQDQVSAVQMAALIHDIGKNAVPVEILSKPGRLSEIEFNLIQTHSQVGYDIVKDIRFPMPIAEIIYQHHERLNGKGYPRGLKADEILLESKIIAVADVVDAMSSHRPYRPALGMDKALEEINKNRGIIYDSDVVDVCCRIMEKGTELIFVNSAVETHNAN